MRPSMSMSLHSVPRSLADDAASVVHRVLRSPGRPIDKATRSFIEPRFPIDVSLAPSYAGNVNSSHGFAVSEPGDRFELEADQVASSVVNGAELSTTVQSF